MDDKKEMLMKLLAARKPKIDIEVEAEEEPSEEEENEGKTDLAPEGKLISTEEEDMEMPMDGEIVEHEDEQQDMDLITEMLGGMDQAQLGKEPKSLRERAIFEALKRKKQA